MKDTCKKEVFTHLVENFNSCRKEKSSEESFSLLLYLYFIRKLFTFYLHVYKWKNTVSFSCIIPVQYSGWKHSAEVLPTAFHQHKPPLNSEENKNAPGLH